MRRVRIVMVLVVALIVQTFIIKAQTGTINLVPNPSELTVKNGFFELNSDTRVAADATLNNEVISFCNSLVPSSGLKLKISNLSSGKNIISLNIDSQLKTDYSDDAYRLIVEKNKIQLTAGSQSGIFYGLQTLLQLLPEQIFSRSKITDVVWNIPCVEILDYPRFEWRGFMLDASRSFQPIEYVKRTLDLMAMHKMNVFHWHLTDDHGWRVEIKKYPWLTEIGAWREQPNYPTVGERQTYGGFYTQEEIREIVKYAEARHITIVPEIDLPGHSSALIYAMPELACKNAERDKYPAYFDDFPKREKKYIRHPGTNVVCAGNEAVYPIIENILSEIIELFPSQYIHVGGDEVLKTWWKECPDCKQRIEDEKLGNQDELQAYFIKRLEKMIIAKGCKLIGWDEILDGGLSETASVMSWRGMSGGIEAIKQGRQVVMASNEGYYIQKGQTDNPLHPQKWPSMMTSKMIYEYNPIPNDFTPEQEKMVLGIQTSLWTPFSHNADIWDIAIYPRNCALSEAAWSPENTKNWDDYQVRMKSHLTRLANQGIAYWREDSEVVGEWDTKDVWNEESVLSFNVTDYIDEAGVYFLVINQTVGERVITIEEAALFQNGKQIASDKHIGTTSAIQNHERIYFLDLQTRSNNESYEIQVKVKGLLGNISKGEIYLFKP
ncbi:MAG: beta-N-acetylhexosaminidase [Bacteroidetes bacterium]|nr:beta-N-acetylhexosaminidase [Bacteroidota bacterium]